MVHTDLHCYGHCSFKTMVIQSKAPAHYVELVVQMVHYVMKIIFLEIYGHLLSFIETSVNTDLVYQGHHVLNMVIYIYLVIDLQHTHTHRYNHRHLQW